MTTSGGRSRFTISPFRSILRRCIEANGTGVLWLCAVWLIFSSLISPASAQSDKPLTIETSSIQPSLALGRPMLTWWDVKIPRAALVTGKFQFLLKSELRLLATAETEELTLNGPEQRIRVVLPAISDAYAIDRVNVEIHFQGKNFSGKVSDQILRIPFSKKKVFVALVGESKTVRNLTLRRQKVIEQLKFENLIPKTKNEQGKDDDQEFIKTFFASLDPTDFASEALAYCGYDVVVLLGEEFRKLRKPQLEGLLTWTKSGGSLYVEPNGVLESYHVDFLRNLVANDPRELVFQVDPTGRVVCDAMPTDQPALVVGIGLGAAAIGIDDPDKDVEPSTEAWRPVIAALWKLRRNPVPAAPIQYNVNNRINGQAMRETFANPDPWGLAAASFEHHRLRHGDLMDRLMPEKFRMVPPWILTLILFTFVMTIGPGEYFVLGWLRSRSLTWLTFPAATLAVTFLTVYLSNMYMSQAETRRAAVLCDVDSTGEIVRTNRFELLFVASSHRVITDVQKGLFSPLVLGAAYDANPFAPGGPWTPQRIQLMQRRQAGFVNPNFQDSEIEDDPNFSPPVVGFVGRIPTQFSVPQDLIKWTPQLNRVFSLATTITKPDVDWSRFDLAIADSNFIRQHIVPPRILERAREQFGPLATSACFTGSDGWAYDRSQAWRSTRSQENPQVYFAPGMGFGGRIDRMPGEADFFRWIYQTSVLLPTPGISMLTKQTAPKGGPDCDDVPLLDSSDVESWLLVVVVPEKEDFVVYRKLMRFQESVD